MANDLFNIGSAQALMTNLRKIRERNKDKVIFYRGHKNKSYELIPSIYRKDVGGNYKYLHIEDKLYKEMLCTCPEEFDNCETTLERLVKMQHYSLPTRLLDITANPLVALYFASQGDDTDGVLYAFTFDKSDVRYFDSPDVCILSNLSQLEYDADLTTEQGKRSLVSKIKGDLPNVYYGDDHMANQVVCLKPKSNNSRIIRQSGAFLLFGMDKKKENMAQLAVKPIVMEVPRDKKQKVREDLKDLGINEAFLFPEIDKVSEYLINNLL